MNDRLDNNAPQFELTAGQQALKERARELAREGDSSRARPMWTVPSSIRGDNVEALRDAGFMGMTIPRSYGGEGRSFLDAALVIDEMAQACGVTGRIVVEANMGAISALMHYGTGGAEAPSAQNWCSPATSLRSASPNPARGARPARWPPAPTGAAEATSSTARSTGSPAAAVSRLHLVFARVFDEQGAEQGIGGFIAVRGETKGPGDRRTRAGHGAARHPRDRDPVRGHGDPGRSRPPAPERIPARVSRS